MQTLWKEDPIQSGWIRQWSNRLTQMNCSLCQNEEKVLRGQQITYTYIRQWWYVLIYWTQNF